MDKAFGFKKPKLYTVVKKYRFVSFSKRARIVNFIRPYSLKRFMSSFCKRRGPDDFFHTFQRYKKFITSLQFANNRIAEGALFAPTYSIAKNGVSCTT